MHNSIIKQVAHCDRNDGSWQNGIVAHSHRTDGSFGCRLFNYRSLNVSVPDEGISPLQEFNRDTRQLVYMDAGVVGEAFMYHESRKVDKGACISFQGRRYETKPKLIGKTVEIAYDPAAPEIITISSEGLESFQAKPLKIGEYCDQRQSLPPQMKAAEPETSRFLDALEKQHEETKKRRADAISFGAYRREV